MDIKQYQAEAQNTKSDIFVSPPTTYDKTSNGTNPIDVLHAIVGIATEGGELLDPIKKAMFYGKKLDYVNLDEEIGDVLWYIAIYCTARGVTIEELATLNNRKLRQRFPNKFTQENALTRDLDAERAVLENMRIGERMCCEDFDIKND